MDLRLRGAGHERVTTVAGNSRLIVLGMDSFLHMSHLFIDQQIRIYCSSLSQNSFVIVTRPCMRCKSKYQKTEMRVAADLKF